MIYIKNLLYEDIKRNFDKDNTFFSILFSEFKKELAFLKENKKTRIETTSIFVFFVIYFFACFLFYIMFQGLLNSEEDIFIGFVLVCLGFFLISILSLFALYETFSNLKLKEIETQYKLALEKEMKNLFPFYKGKEEISTSINFELERIASNKMTITSEEASIINEIVNNLNEMVKNGIHLKSSLYKEKIKTFHFKLMTNEYLENHNSLEKELLSRFKIPHFEKNNIIELKNKISNISELNKKYFFLKDLISSQIYHFEKNNIESELLDKAQSLLHFLQEKIDNETFLNKENFEAVCVLTANLISNMENEEEALESRISNKITSHLEKI